MRVKKINYISYAMVGILALVCIYFIYKTVSLKQDVDRLIDSQMAKTTSAQIGENIAKADSLLIQGNYKAALEQYEQLSNSTGLNTELRKTMTIKLLAMDKKIRREQANNTENENEPVKSTFSETPTVKAFDSLNFALEKAELQLSSVKNQMQEKIFGEYITFKSTKGNRLHYVGQVKNKKANGIGIAILDSGSRYEGEWQNNKRHGQGTFYWIDGEHYEGSYKDDLRSGQGTYYWTNGEKYVGNWEKDMRNGKGTFYGKDGKVLTSGVWKDDKLVEEDK